MSWWKTATENFYAVISPETYHEWMASGVIPRGSVFFVEHPGNIFAEKDRMLVGLISSPDNFRQNRKGRKTTNKDIPAVTDSLKLLSGEIPSQEEILYKHDDMEHKLRLGLDQFKAEVINRGYLIYGEDEPRLVVVKDQSDDYITLADYGSMPEIIKLLHETLAKMKAVSQQNAQRGGSNELSDIAQLSNILIYANDNNLPLDKTKVDFILKMTQMSPAKISRISWKKCYLQSSMGAGLIEENRKRFNRLNWPKNRKQPQTFQ